MTRSLAAVYGAGRLAFGAGLLVAPERLGGVLLGDEARLDPVRVTLRTYGTRDTIIGLGALAAVSGRGDVRPWLMAGLASDVLDAALQAFEWSSLPEDRRRLGMIMALGSACAGAALLAR